MPSHAALPAFWLLYIPQPVREHKLINPPLPCVVANRGLVKISSSKCHASHSRIPFPVRCLTLNSCFRILRADLYESILPRMLLAIPHTALLLYVQ